MKKFKSLILIPFLTVVALAVALFAGCGAKDKVYSVQGMNITLTDDFHEQSIITQTAVWQTSDEIVTALKESFSDLNSTFDINSSSYTCKEYLELVVRMNSLSATVSENDNYAYFSYTKTVSGKDFYYYATGHKDTDCFWLIQFACLAGETDKHQSDFEKYAASVTFDSMSTDNTL